MQHNFSGAFNWQINTVIECRIFCLSWSITIEILFKVAENFIIVYKEIPFSAVCCTFQSHISVNHALESYGSGRGFIIACEKSRRIVCNDHSSQPYKVHMTDSNENRAKHLESVVWKYQLLWNSHFFWMNHSCSPYSISSPFTWIIYAKIKTQNSKINWNTISDTITQTSLSCMKQKK